MYIAMTQYDFERLTADNENGNSRWIWEYQIYGAATKEQMQALIRQETREEDSDLMTQDYVLLEISRVLNVDIEVHTTIGYSPYQREE